MNGSTKDEKDRKSYEKMVAYLENIGSEWHCLPVLALAEFVVQFLGDHVQNHCVARVACTTEYSSHEVGPPLLRRLPLGQPVDRVVRLLLRPHVLVDAVQLVVPDVDAEHLGDVRVLASGRAAQAQ